MVRLAVTGAGGFCGSAVARLAAARGLTVVGLGRRPGPVHDHRYWDATTGPPDLSGVDAVVHLAAAVGDPSPGAATEAAFRAVNVDGVARLLDALGDRPLVLVSSASVYAPATGPVTEDHPVADQRTAYGRTKAAGERLALDAGAVVLRPRAVYGPGDPYLLPRLRRAVRAGRVLLPGPDVRLSLTAVENLADACLAALGWPAGAYNVADGEVYSRDAVVTAALAMVGVPVRVVRVPVGLVRAVAAVAVRVSSAPTVTPYAVDQLTGGLVLDIGRATALGWRPRRTFWDESTGP